MSGGLLAKWLGAAPFSLEQTQWILVMAFMALAGGYWLACMVHGWRGVKKNDPRRQ
jgi:hypothetical protein